MCTLYFSTCVNLVNFAERAVDGDMSWLSHHVVTHSQLIPGEGARAPVGLTPLTENHRYRYFREYIF
jgi:hypothetical protein